MTTTTTKFIDEVLYEIYSDHYKEVVDELGALADGFYFFSLVENCKKTNLTIDESDLLIEIVKDNLDFYKTLNEELPHMIKKPRWSKELKPSIRTCKIENNGTMQNIVIKYTDNKIINSRLEHIQKQRRYNGMTSQEIVTTLTEKNIRLVVQALEPLNFDIDHTIMEYYNTIQSWDYNSVAHKFMINTLSNPACKEMLLRDLGPDTPLDSNIIADRSLRYQYIVDKLKNPSTLTEEIANRSETTIWVDNTQTKLSEIIASLIELKRLPLLVIFDNYTGDNDANANATKLNELLEALQDNNIVDDIGVYFRVPNDRLSGGIDPFNQIIQDRKLNGMLTDSTKVAVLRTGRVPKFIIKDNWAPMSVITLDTGLNNNISSYFTTCCDCVINYTKNKPIIKNKNTNYFFESNAW